MAASEAAKAKERVAVWYGVSTPIQPRQTAAMHM